MVLVAAPSFSILAANLPTAVSAGTTPANVAMPEMTCAVPPPIFIMLAIALVTVSIPSVRLIMALRLDSTGVIDVISLYMEDASSVVRVSHPSHSAIAVQVPPSSAAAKATST